MTTEFCSSRTLSVVTLLATTIAGCTLNNADGSDDVATTREPIIAGTPISAIDSGQVLLQRDDGAACSGVLMDNNWVLTGRTCFDAMDAAAPRRWSATMGPATVSVREVLRNPEYEVVLLKLDAPMPMFGRSQGFRRELFPHRTNTLRPGTLLSCFGFGSNAPDGAGFGTLRTAQLPLRGTGFHHWVHWFRIALDTNSFGQAMTFGDAGGDCLLPDSIGRMTLAYVHRGSYVDPFTTFNDGVDPDAFRNWYNNLRTQHQLVNLGTRECVSANDSEGAFRQACWWGRREHCALGGALCWTGEYLQWRINPVGGTEYELRIADTGLCLTATAENSVTVGDCVAAPQTRWMLRGATGEYQIQSRLHNNCLEVPAAPAVDDLSLRTATCNALPAQQWRFEARFPEGLQSFASREAGASTCIDVPGANPDSGAPLQLWSCHGGRNQRWEFHQNATDLAERYMASPDHTKGQCLDVPWASNVDGVQLVQHACHAGAHQRIFGIWQNGAYILRMGHSGKCISAQRSGVRSNGTPIIQQTCGDQNHEQAWLLY